MVLYGPIATLWNGGADQLKFPADQLKLHGCVHFTKETCVCGFKMSKNGPSEQSKMTKEQSWPQGAHIWQVVSMLGNKIGGRNKFKKNKACEKDWGARKTVKEKIKYNHNRILIQTRPIWSPPQPYTNDPISDSGCTGNYLDALKTVLHTKDPPENPIKVKLPNSSTMSSTYQAHIPLHNLSS